MPSVNEAEDCPTRRDGRTPPSLLAACRSLIQSSPKQSRWEARRRGASRVRRPGMLGTMRPLPRRMDANSTGSWHTETGPKGIPRPKLPRILHLQPKQLPTEQPSSLFPSILVTIRNLPQRKIPNDASRNANHHFRRPRRSLTHRIKHSRSKYPSPRPRSPGYDVHDRPRNVHPQPLELKQFRLKLLGRKPTHSNQRKQSQHRHSYSHASRPTTPTTKPTTTSRPRRHAPIPSSSPHPQIRR